MNETIRGFAKLFSVAKFTKPGLLRSFEIRGFFQTKTIPNDNPRSNADTILVSTMKVQLTIFNEKIKSGKLFSFPILTDRKFFPRLENDQTFFHIFPDSVGTLQSISKCTVQASPSKMRRKLLKS